MDGGFLIGRRGRLDRDCVVNQIIIPGMEEKKEQTGHGTDECLQVPSFLNAVMTT